MDRVPERFVYRGDNGPCVHAFLARLKRAFGARDARPKVAACNIKKNVASNRTSDSLRLSLNHAAFSLSLSGVGADTR